MLCFRRIIIKEKMRLVFSDIEHSIQYYYNHPSALIRVTNKQFQAYFCLVCGEYEHRNYNLYLVSSNCICKCICKIKTKFVNAKYIVNMLYYMGGDRLLHYTINTCDIFDGEKRLFYYYVLDYYIEKEKKYIPYEIKVIIYQYIGIYIHWQ